HAFLAPVLSYGEHAVTLALKRNAVRFDHYAQTPNQRALAQGVESLGMNNALYDTLLVMNPDEVPGMLAALSGEVHPSTTAALYSASAFARQLPLKHLRNNLDAPARPGAPLAQAY